METLSSLTWASFPLSHPVARSSSDITCWGQVLADVAATRSLIGQKEGGSWALYEKDSYRFLVGLLALLAEGIRVYIPGENHAAMIESLEGEGVRFLGVFPTASDPVPIPSGDSFSEIPLVIGGEIVVFTSGSTGDAKTIPKSLAQIDAELLALESLWGEQLGDATVIGTVSHQHLYGLLFSVIWPLCSGRCFWRQPFIDPLALTLEAAALPRSTWIMSPAHLHRLSDEIPWENVRGTLAIVFSSGGPLNASSAQDVFDKSGQYPVEVLGSSETGGIAWRRQSTHQARWQPLPGVGISCSEEGALVVRSPFLPVWEWYVTADAAAIDTDGSFILGGRLDRIVKIEGKRVSLPEVERLLRAHSWVEEAVAISLANRRQRVGAVLVLGAEGEQQYGLLGHQKFFQSLRGELSNRLPATAVPRIWRIALELPKNSQGKLLFREIKSLFEAERYPRITKQEITESSCRVGLFIASDCPYLEGHFPGAPVLPGVVQIMWAEKYARQFLGVGGPFLGMRAVKFKELVRPETELILNLDYDADRGRLKFTYDSTVGRHSQGRLHYGLDE